MNLEKAGFFSNEAQQPYRQFYVGRIIVAIAILFSVSLPVTAAPQSKGLPDLIDSYNRVVGEEDDFLKRIAEDAVSSTKKNNCGSNNETHTYMSCFVFLTAARKPTSGDYLQTRVAYLKRLKQTQISEGQDIGSANLDFLGNLLSLFDEYDHKRLFINRISKRKFRYTQSDLEDLKTAHREQSIKDIQLARKLARKALQEAKEGMKGASASLKSSTVPAVDWAELEERVSRLNYGIHNKSKKEK